MMKKQEKEPAAVSALEAGDNEKEKLAGTPATNVFVCDECGDTLWDAVLAQEDKKESLQKVINDIKSS